MLAELGSRRIPVSGATEVVTVDDGRAGPLSGSAAGDLHVIPDGAVAVRGGRIVGLFASAGLNLGAARFHVEFRYNYLLSGTSKLSYITPGFAASFRL